MDHPPEKPQDTVDDDVLSITSSYEMLSALFDFEAVKQERNFAIKRYKNATYRGQLNQEIGIRKDER